MPDDTWVAALTHYVRYICHAMPLYVWEDCNATMNSASEGAAACRRHRGLMAKPGGLPEPTMPLTVRDDGTCSSWDFELHRTWAHSMSFRGSQICAFKNVATDMHAYLLSSKLEHSCEGSLLWDAEPTVS